MTSSELIDLIKSKNEAFAEISTVDESVEIGNLCYLDKLDGTRDLIGNKIYQGMESGTGGYLEFIMKYASKILFNYNLSEDNIKTRILRNSDYKVKCIIMNYCHI